MITTSGFSAPAPVGSPAIPTVPVTMDSKGRVRTSKEQRRVILAEFERSGVSATQFAKVTGLKYSTLAGWLQRCRRGKKALAQPVRLLEAMVEQAQPAASSATVSALVLRWEGGTRMEINDAKQIPMAAALIRALAHS